MSYHNTSNNVTQSRVNAQGQIAPDGYHYMPDGTLMSDVEHAEIYGSGGTIESFNLDTTNVKAGGENRRFTVTGNGVFSLEIKNKNNYYYNFVTNVFQVARARLDNQTINNTYTGYIEFPSAPSVTDTVNGAVTDDDAVTMDTAVATKMAVGDRVTGTSALNARVFTVASIDDTLIFSLSSSTDIDDGATLTFSSADQYDVYLFAEQGTKYADYREVRFADGSLDINSSIGSNSNLVQKVLYQTLDIDLTLSAISTSAATLFLGTAATDQVITTQIGKNTGKIPFSIPVSAGATHSFRINRTPTIDDVAIFTTRTIGSAPLPIEGEDVSGSTYYRWPLDNIDRLSSGMIARGTNITSGSIISSNEDVTIVMGGTEGEEKIVQTKASALDALGGKPTITRDSNTKKLTTIQTGNITFNKQQAAALADDAIKIYGYGTSAIKTLSGWEIELSDMAVTLTKPTALVASATVNSTTVDIDDGDGIMDDVSIVNSFNIDSSATNPTVTNIGSYTGTTATLTLSAAQSLEAGETLTFDGAGRTITISGNIEIKKVGEIVSGWDGVLFFDLERFITATNETS